MKALQRTCPSLKLKPATTGLSSNHSLHTPILLKDEHIHSILSKQIIQVGEPNLSTAPTTNPTTTKQQPSKGANQSRVRQEKSSHKASETPQSTALVKSSVRIDNYLRNHMVDAHLSVVQTCRVCLVGFGLVSFCTSIGANTSRERLQCSLTASACFLSSVYYTRLYKLRRLPVALGYSMESNTVAESMRYANWTIVIALLGICAFLLRGPFQDELVGPFDWTWWSWSYETWRVGGPLLSSAGTIVSLPGWHASRAARAEQMKKNVVGMYLWLVACVLFLSLSAFTSLITLSVMLKPLKNDPPARTESEIALGRSISLLWFVYPIISFVRTVAIVLGAGDWGVDVVAASEAPQTVQLPIYKALLYNVVHALSSLVRYSFLAFVASPEETSSIAVSRLYAMTDGVLTMNELEHANQATDRIPLIDRQTHAGLERMQMHVPEVTPLCSQGVDSILAIVDIFSQALSALGCASLTLPR